MIKIDKNDLIKIFDSLVFLNMTELKNICHKYEIPYNIFIEYNDKIKKTNEVDHKEIIINNILFKK